MSNFLFADDDNTQTPDTDEPLKGVWKVLIVDDEHEVHSVTRLALSGFTFEQRSLEIHSAYSADEAKALLDDHQFALALVDVVMETDTAGLDLVQYIREELKNKDIRLILRTGQPGQAPEHKVISDYDINDYKAKTELTSQKLFTLMHSSLRSYRDIEILQRSRIGLSHIIKSSRNIFELKGFIDFVQSTLEQITALINVSHSLVMSTDSSAFEFTNASLQPICGVGKFENLADVQSSEQWPLIAEAIRDKTSIYSASELVVYCQNAQHTLIFYVTGFDHLDDIDRDLINLFADNVVVALENIRIHQQTTLGHQYIVARLAEVIEKRQPTHSLHVVRVAELCQHMSRLLQQPDNFTMLIRLAAPLHDIGKIALGTNLLLKQGQLSDAEWQQVKQYPNWGATVLNSQDSDLMRMAAEIAQNLHEKFDGTGYPNQLSGSDIPLSARICAVCNAFDAMLNNTSYRDALSENKVTSIIEAESNKSYDPLLVNLLLSNLEEFLSIRQQFSDQTSEIQ